MKQPSRLGEYPPTQAPNRSHWRGMLPALGSLMLSALIGGSLTAQDKPADSAPAIPPPAAEQPVIDMPAANPAPVSAPTPAPATAVNDGPPPAPPQQKELPPEEPISLRDLVNSLSQNDIQEAITALRANFINPAALTEDELNRAALEGLISRLDHGAILELSSASAARDAEAIPFQAEILDNRVGYIRLGPLSDDSIGQLDAALHTVAERKIPAVALDLRATAESSDYALAEKVVSRFAAKGKPLFTIRRPGAKQEQIFTSKADPIFTGFVVILVDADTAGSVETIAGAIRQQTRSIIAGHTTQGRAVEYSNVALSNGRTLRIATGKIVLPPDQAIFPGGVKPDLHVSLSAEDQDAIFKRSRTGGMSQFVFETERPRLNEAALVAGTNPSIDAYQETRRNPGSGRGPLRDTVLQRAMDVVTSIQVIEFKSAVAPPVEAAPETSVVSPENVPSPEAQGAPAPPDRPDD